jgi:hypothetical protein
MNNALEREQWCQRTTEEETIVALQAQVKKLFSSARADKKGGKEGKSKGKPKGKSKGMVKASDRKGGASNKWKKVAPKESESTTKSKRVERNGIGAPNTRHQPSTRNWNSRELTSSQATIVSRKSQSQRI